MNRPTPNTNAASHSKWKWGADERNCIGAACETTDPVELEKMAGDIMTGRILDEGIISEELVLNGKLPFRVAEELARRFGNDFAYELSSRSDATPEVLDEFCDHFDSLVTNTIAVHANTSLETLVKMTQSKNPYTAGVAISTGRLPESALAEFANSDEPPIRQAVALVTSSPVMLKKLASDESPIVRAAVAGNPCTAIAVIEKMALETDCLPAKVAAAKRSVKTDVLEKLGNYLLSNYNAHLADELKQNPNASEGIRVAAALM